MTSRQNPEAADLGAGVDDAGSEIDVSMVRQPDDGRRNLRMRSPHLAAVPPGPPRSGRLFGVRYVDSRGQGVTMLFRHRDAALRLVVKVESRGGRAAVYWTTELGRWTR